MGQQANYDANFGLAQSMQYQASKNQLHLTAWSHAVENTYSAGNSSSCIELLPDPQCPYQNMSYDQPECYSFLMNRASIHGPSLQNSQHAHQINLNPQPNFYSSMVSMGCSYAQSLADPQRRHILNPQPNFHSSMVNMGSSYAQSLQDLRLNQSILHPEPDFHSLMVNMDSSQAQSITDPQHVQQNVINPRPDLNPFMLNTGYVNPIMQSHASSLSNYPYHSGEIGVPHIPQEVVTSASYSTFPR